MYQVTIRTPVFFVAWNYINVMAIEAFLASHKVCPYDVQQIYQQIRTKKRGPYLFQPLFSSTKQNQPLSMVCLDAHIRFKQKQVLSRTRLAMRTSDIGRLLFDPL